MSIRVSVKVTIFSHTCAAAIFHPWLLWFVHCLWKYLTYLILQSNSTFKQRVTRKLISHALGVVGCTGLMFTSYFTITGDEQFYKSFIMPSVMRVLGAEQAHTFAVWLASKGLIPVDVDGDPEILVNLENKDFQWFFQKHIFFSWRQLSQE